MKNSTNHRTGTTALFVPGSRKGELAVIPLTTDSFPYTNIPCILCYFSPVFPNPNGNTLKTHNNRENSQKIVTKRVIYTVTIRIRRTRGKPCQIPPDIYMKNHVF